MNRLRIDTEKSPAELRHGLAAIQAEFPYRFRSAPSAFHIRFEQLHDDSPISLHVTREARGPRIRYRKPIHAFRALGRLLGETISRRASAFSETARFDMLGVMLDASRNAVPTEATTRSFLCRFALMGIDTFMLYTEDTYEVPGEPFFGYLRGAFSQAELRRLDQFARHLGIEMFPCIQTLAHLEQILQWPAYFSYRDTEGVLLAEEEKTYELVEKMIRAASAPFRSKRIHLGMDEAHGIGTGEYKRRHGDRSPFKILNRHLTCVRDICRRLGLRPMIWSDMYFRLGSKTNNYYDPESVIPPGVAAAIPRDIQLVYWDYYHHTPDFYSEWIQRHRALGSEPVVASGAWAWDRFWTQLPHTLSNVTACMRACKRKGVRETFLTIWGDDGTECDYYSALAGAQYFAEHGYREKIDDQLLRANFRGSCDAGFDDWVRASELDCVPCLTGRQRITNVSKWLLWDDPLLAVMSPQLDRVSLRRHYTALAKALETAADQSTAAARLRFPAALARVLSRKCDLHRELTAVYARRDRAKLKRFVERELPALSRAVTELWRTHRAMWFATYKPFGWEVLEARYGRLLARLDTTALRVRDFLGDRIAVIPELEARRHKLYDQPASNLPSERHARVATPSALK